MAMLNIFQCEEEYFLFAVLLFYHFTILSFFFLQVYIFINMKQYFILYRLNFRQK